MRDNSLDPNLDPTGLGGKKRERERKKELLERIALPYL